ncbi:putative phosphatase [Bradyrhizobium sp. YR681]|nr:putative phosphatase [Bradyrhizobium sp. YR681]
MAYIRAMQAYFFDLDGTLTDSRAGLYPAFRCGLEAIGVHSVSDAQLKLFLGTPLPQVFRAMRPDVSQDEIDRGMAAFRALFERTGIVANELYPGVIDLLRSIRKRGSVIWVVTSKPQNQAIEVVSFLKLDRYVAGVIGAGLAETDTKTDLVARALAAAHADSRAAVMVGDRSYDVVGAIGNGVLPVGALWGYGSEDELKAAGCRHFAKSPDDFRMAYVETNAGFVESGLAAAAGRY